MHYDDLIGPEGSSDSPIDLGYHAHNFHAISQKLFLVNIRTTNSTLVSHKVDNGLNSFKISQKTLELRFGNQIRHNSNSVQDNGRSLRPFALGRDLPVAEQEQNKRKLINDLAIFQAACQLFVV